MSKKQLVFVLAKIAFAGVVLALLFHNMDTGKVWNSVRHAEILPILAGVVLCWGTIFIAGWRWHRLLQAFEIAIPLRVLVCVAQIGQFFLVFLPGPAGDDLTRMLYISRLSKGRVGEACTTVILDRIIGLSSILMTAVFFVPWQWHVLAASPEKKAFWLVVAICAAGVGVLLGAIFFFLGSSAAMQRLAEKGLGLLPRSGIFDELSKITKRIFTIKASVAKVVCAAIFTQFLLCGVFYLAGRSVGIQLPFATWLGFVPIVLAANAVPITIAGIGVREVLMKLFLLALAGIASEQAVAASLVAFAMMLVNSLLGGILYIFFRPQKKDVAPVPVS